MTDPKLVPDMSTPEGMTTAIEHLREHTAIEAEVTPKSDESEGGGDLRRVVDLELLRILEEAGVDGIDTIQEEFGRTEPSSGKLLYEDVGEIGDAYGEEAKTAGDDPLEQAKLRRVEGVAHAVSDIALAAFAAADGNGAAAAETLDEREEILDSIGEDEESLLAKMSLEELIGNMRDILPTAED